MSKTYAMGTGKKKEAITVADPFVCVYDDKSAGPSVYNTEKEAIEDCPAKWRESTTVVNFSALTDKQKSHIKNFPPKEKEVLMRHDD
jgi:hypothetical protein